LKILPECQSILVLGIRYPASLFAGSDYSSGAGKVASYALGDDYHDVLPVRMRGIVAYIEELVGNSVPNRWYTDTGPILERELAQRAGLGWIGKNSCLINQKLGSYFLLAEILLGIELVYDDPVTQDHCGSCTRCLDHCPTACITPERTIDANRCISYLSIEHRDFIPLELRPRMGNWIFGCDVCQQVCPWNRKVGNLGVDPVFSSRPEKFSSALTDELSLTPQEFNRRFKGSPIKRPKRRGYLRNVAIALGNIGDRNAIPALMKALDDFEPLVRGHAAWALGQIGGENVLLALLTAVENENDEDVLSEIKASMKRCNFI
jgi:epoxyqueuosine reductase